MSPILNAVMFAGLAVGVWIAGTRLTRLSDAIADRFSLSRSLMGLAFLASATSLPEMVTTVAGALRDQPTLVLNNLVGGIVLQTAILAIADAFSSGPITAFARRADHILEAGLLIVLLAVAGVAMVVAEPVALGRFGLGALCLGALYAVAVVLLRRNRGGEWVPVDLPETPAAREAAKTVRHATPAMLIGLTVFTCLAIALFGTGLVMAAERIAIDTGWGTGFVGVTLLALVTSMPELSTTIAAVRIRAYELAISNVFGSNLIMLAMVLPADFLTPSPILRSGDALALLAVLLGVMASAIYLVGFVVRRKPVVLGTGLDSVLVLATYGVSVALFALLR